MHCFSPDGSKVPGPESPFRRREELVFRRQLPFLMGGIMNRHGERMSKWRSLLSYFETLASIYTQFPPYPLTKEQVRVLDYKCDTVSGYLKSLLVVIKALSVG